MRKKQERYDSDFRRKAIELSDLPGKTATMVEKELGIYQG
jgi:transposase-like protein